MVVNNKPTYNKLTSDFIRRGGKIITGEAAAAFLKYSNAYASYIVNQNLIFISNEPTVSDILEETYHATQDRMKLYSNYSYQEMMYLREIDAQNYLISVAKKYKIPIEEQEVTKNNLKFYEEALKKFREGRD